jgi:hypothetical protein
MRDKSLISFSLEFIYLITRVYQFMGEYIHMYLYFFRELQYLSSLLIQFDI